MTRPGELEARSLTAGYGDQPALADVSLHMPAGTITTLVGPSGCGKTTFLRALNLLHGAHPGESLEGTVLLDGVDLRSAARAGDASEVRRAIGMVFQQPNVFPGRSVAHNLLAGPRIAGLAVADPAALIESSLWRAGLWDEVRDHLDADAASLSLGQQQRLCLARALTVSPRVLLLDEPCAALDPLSTAAVEASLVDLRRDLTLVVATHNLGQAERLGGRCAFFMAEGGGGRIVEAGPSRSIFDSPTEPLTADYLAGRFG